MSKYILILKMKGLDLVKGCECKHCQRKLKQIRQSRVYWDNLIVSEKKAA